MAYLDIHRFSSALAMEVSFGVVLPEQMEGSCPTLFLLHGMGDDRMTWLRRTDIERCACERGIAVVLPEAHLSWYADTAYGYPYFTYISKELPDVCRRFFHGVAARRETTFAAGNSMGGYGAFKLALAANDTFGAAASFSGGLVLQEMPQEGPKVLYDGIYGDSASIKGSDNDLFVLAERLKKSGKPLPRLYEWCGKQDSLYSQSTAMRDQLNRLGYDLTYEEDNGAHCWEDWGRKLPHVLDWLSSGCRAGGEKQAK